MRRSRKDEYIVGLLADQWQTRATWYERAAALAFGAGAYLLIWDREGIKPYMLRFWLSPPVLTPEDDYESGDSLLLHFFLRPDNDGALHDHPWDFWTSIIVGGYQEFITPESWTRHSMLGPEYGAYSLSHVTGASIFHEARDLHAVARLDAPTVWTLVRTGPRYRAWGFHPPGRPWMPYKQYLSERASAGPYKETP